MSTRVKHLHSLSLGYKTVFVIVGVVVIIITAGGGVAGVDAASACALFHVFVSLCLSLWLLCQFLFMQLTLLVKECKWRKE